jgi:hypothetical protein
MAERAAAVAADDHAQRRAILTPADHGHILHSEGRGFVTIAQRIHGSWHERGVPIADLDYYLHQLDPHLDSYISQNRFYSPRRRIAFLVQADALFSDLDFYSLGKLKSCDPRWVLDFALQLLDQANIPAPTFATASGRGLALVWLHTPIPRRALPRWRACQDAIFGVLKPLGADPKARDAARVLRLVGTRNTRSGTLVETISGIGAVWDFDTIATEILPIQRDEIKTKRLRRSKDRAITAPNGFTAATLWASRLDDFQKLIMHRYGALRAPSGQRDLLMLLYSIGMSYLVHSPEQLRQEMQTIAADICGWSAGDTDTRLSSVFSRTRAAFQGKRIEYMGGERDPRYRYKDASLVEMLGVNEREMRELDLRHLVSAAIKRERDRDRKREARRAAGAIPREAYLSGSLSRQRPWEREAICRRTWERRRHQNTSGTPAVVASPSGCMVAEPPHLGRLPEREQRRRRAPDRSAREQRAFRTLASEDTGYRPLAIPSPGEPGAPGDLGRAGEPRRHDEPLMQKETSAFLAVIRCEVRQLELPLGIPQPRASQSEIREWRDGAVPVAVREMFLSELRARGMRHRELAQALPLSRPQLTNVLRGRFGTSVGSVRILKRILAAWGLAA